MLTSGRLPRHEYGGPLLVLGALKVKDAENQPTAERRRIEYTIAARYLTEARAYGVPENREVTGDFLLGKSLIESGQLDEGVRILTSSPRTKFPIRRSPSSRIACWPKHVSSCRTRGWPKRLSTTMRC